MTATLNVSAKAGTYSIIQTQNINASDITEYGERMEIQNLPFIQGNKEVEANAESDNAIHAGTIENIQDSDIDGDSDSSGVELEQKEKEICVDITDTRLLQDEGESRVSVTELFIEYKVIKNMKDTGNITDGEHQLLNLVWRGTRQLSETCWCLSLPQNLKEEKLRKIMQVLCAALLDPRVEVIRNVKKKLLHTFSTYLLQIVWNNGPVFYLGHLNKKKRKRCILESKNRKAIQALLFQILSGCASDSSEMIEYFQVSEWNISRVRASTCQLSSSASADLSDSSMDERLNSLVQEKFQHWCLELQSQMKLAQDNATAQVQNLQVKMQEEKAKQEQQLEKSLFKCKAELLWRMSEKDQQFETRIHDMHMQDFNRWSEIVAQQQKTRTKLHQLQQMFEKQIGLLQQQVESEVGAVGGHSDRSAYVAALSDIELTTKDKAKEEEMTFNQYQSLRLDPDALPINQAVSLSVMASSIPSLVPNKIEDSVSASSLPSLAGDSYSPPDTDTTRKKEDTSGSDDEDAVTDQLLDVVSIRSGGNDSSTFIQKLKDSVRAALKESVSAPRAKCLDTVLCLDVSDSVINTYGLKRIKDVALSFVNGVEDLMDEMDLEENIAVVSMGQGARVIQHLTNDLTLVRDTIESLNGSGGRSPFVEAILVCMAAIKGKGGAVNVAGVYKVRPRIIFITDGLPTDEFQDIGPDIQSNLSQVKFSIVQTINQLMSKKCRSSSISIFWVPVGDADEVTLQSFSKLSGGKMVRPADMEHLCRYYKIQQTIGRLLKMVKNHSDDYREDDALGSLAIAISSSITENERREIVEQVKKLQKTARQSEEVDPDDYDNVFENKEKVLTKELLPLGTRVVRGKDWKWKNQDTDGAGTVIQHSKKDNWLYVKWDNGIHNAYRYNEDGKVDLQETRNHPRLLPANSVSLDFGVRVVRGPNWKAGQEDGKGQGTVIRWHETEKKAKVHWDVTGKIHEYNYSEAKGREIQPLMPEFTNSTGSRTENFDNLKTLAHPERNILIWKWRDDQRRWRIYDQDAIEKLEREFQKRKTGSCVITRKESLRRVSFRSMQEKTVNNGTVLDVEREMVSEENKNDLLALELSLHMD